MCFEYWHTCSLLGNTEESDETEIECLICGYMAKTKRGLKIHNGKKKLTRMTITQKVAKHLKTIMDGQTDKAS